MMPSVDLIRAERYRQQQSEGYSPEEDKGRAHELAAAAAVYALAVAQEAAPGYEVLSYDEWGLPANWPWDGKYWKPKDAERNLIRAGALIVAALDSLRSNTK